MNATLMNFLIGMASSFGFAIVIYIIRMNWDLIKPRIKRLFTSLDTRYDTDIAGREQQARLSNSTREGIMLSADLTTDDDFEAANGSVQGEVPLTELAAASIDHSDDLDKTDHTVDVETCSPLVKANQVTTELGDL